ncbi:MAG: hypothetical protein EBY26_05935 [Microbacteriaceae bacterium]|nr:hypothetical protein [Microbacteriaceae bacterium]
MQLSMQTILKVQPVQLSIANKWQAGDASNIDARCPAEGELMEQLASGTALCEALADLVGDGSAEANTERALFEDKMAEGRRTGLKPCHGARCRATWWATASRYLTGRA